jgi:hypothetical protein
MTNRHDHNPDNVAVLLRTADDAIPPPVMKAGLAGRVLARVSRRRRRRRIAAATVLGITAVVGAFLMNAMRARDAESMTRVVVVAPPTAEPDPVRLGAALEEARAEAAERLAIAHRLIALERSRRQHALSHTLGLTPFDSQTFVSPRAEAALTLVSLADRLRDRLDRPDDALATYRRAAELFPDTPSAAVARQRMGELQSQPKT